MSVKRNRQEDNPLDGNDGTEADRAVRNATFEEEGSLPEISSEIVDPEVADEGQEVDVDWEAQDAAQKERVLRLHAEMENLRTRTARELADQRKYGCMPLLKDILPVIDNINRAIESAQPEDHSAQQKREAKPNMNPSGLLEGFQLVRQQLLSILEQHHCEPVDALGQPFDPQFHEAILQQPSEDQPKDHVMMVTQAGYRLYDRVVRASKVIVSAGPAED
jgi:molecular chaperone GrpE